MKCIRRRAANRKRRRGRRMWTPPDPGSAGGECEQTAPVNGQQKPSTRTYRRRMRAFNRDSGGFGLVDDPFGKGGEGYVGLRCVGSAARVR